MEAVEVIDTVEILIESETLLGFLPYYSFGYIILSLACWFGGVAAHFLKRCYMEDMAIVDYWKSKPYASVSSIVAGLVVYLITLITSGNANLITFFTIGYILDSVINRTEKRNV